MYNQTREWLEAPPEDCSISVIAPDEAFNVKRLTMDKRKLALGYRTGTNVARRRIRAQRQAA